MRNLRLLHETPSMGFIKRKSRSLKLINVDADEVLAQEPVGIDYDILENGLTYYVQCDPKPRMHAALALAVKAISVLGLSSNPLEESGVREDDEEDEDEGEEGMLASASPERWDVLGLAQDGTGAKRSVIVGQS